MLERTLKGHLVQLPCNEQQHLQLDQGAQNLLNGEYAPVPLTIAVLNTWRDCCAIPSYRYSFQNDGFFFLAFTKATAKPRLKYQYIFSIQLIKWVSLILNCFCLFHKEINPCLENNGGCDKNAECTQTGPNQVSTLSVSISKCLPTLYSWKRKISPSPLCF